MRHQNEGLEVLRCWLMFLIVLMHCATFVNTGNGAQARLVHTFCVFGVNAFALISGYFGVRFSSWKVAKLLGLGLFAAVVLTVLSFLAGFGWNFSYSLGWFGNSYLALLFLSPLLNAGIDGLRNRGEGVLQSAWWAYVGVMVLNWLPLDLLGIDLHIPGWVGHSFNQICFMYVTGRVLSGYAQVWRCRMRYVAVVAALAMMANYAWAVMTGVTRNFPTWQALLVGRRGNDNPIIVILAVSIFIIFLRTQFPEWLRKLCVWLGPSMFSVYLLHEASNHDVSVRLYNQFLVFYEPSGFASRILLIFTCATLVFGICLCCDLARRMAMVLLERKDRI